MKSHLKIAKLESDNRELERRLEWAESMFQRYLEAGYLPARSQEEALKFINGPSSDNPYDRIAKARTILEPGSTHCQECKLALWALAGIYPSREARLEIRRIGKNTSGNNTYPKAESLVSGSQT